MKRVTIRRASFEQIVSQAEAEFPDECCGFIIGDDEVRPFINVQNALHAKDPAQYPRDARTAWVPDAKHYIAALDEIDARKVAHKAIYHSHPEHDAYFSATDRERACTIYGDEPDYPDAAQIVLSIRGGKFARAAVFVWDALARDFVEAELVLI